MTAVADPEFPRGGGGNPREGAPTYYLAIFFLKLHENEEILGGGARPLDPPLDSLLILFLTSDFWCSMHYWQ